MTDRTPPNPEGALLRRRVIIELTQQELPLLAAAEHRHGTKRAAIIAALTALAGLEGPRAPSPPEGTGRASHSKLEALRRERGDADIARTHVERERDQARAALARVEAERDEARGALDQRVDELRRAQRSVTDLIDHLQQEEARADAAEERERRLASAAPSALYCAHCQAWAPQAEWAWRDDGDGAVCYHRPCGDHAPGILHPASWLARRDHAPGEKPAP